MLPSGKACLRCQGTGESVTEGGPEPCPDCFGEGNTLSEGTKVEWRLREIERTSGRLGQEGEANVRWLIHELRASRAALLDVLTRCQDADECDLMARDIRHRANEALKLYDPT
jgi:hypothetical protein